ncbi:hypothetical protein [Pseudoxanthomonas sp. JBR18]|uniref:hypothetical protein n=1 Tax=Pseudoxanthomonas sp. JBR18 TaxID=2969308 RepID=UPI0023052183|nr:hypothetical protein [Pseudoxanthomonas sp. JBR18]WCE02811.1 hypothetical protein PJ250_11720 [Pseudoxanthomonas sp. JBR18]
MIGTVLQFTDLQELCKPGGRPTLATVEAWAIRIKLRYTYDGKGGLITTVDAFNAAIGLGQAANQERTYSAEDLIG